MGGRPRVSILCSYYRGVAFLEGFLENCAKQTISGETELVLVLNDPTDRELCLVESFAAGPLSLRPVVTQRESFAASMNRGVQHAAAEYLCVGNVDDRRTPWSLESQADALDQHPGAAFAYGHYVVVSKIGSNEGRLVRPQDFDQSTFVRGMHAGPFVMWRADAGRRAGPWDEQFRVAGDYDFCARLAFEGHGVPVRRTLGYYLNDGSGLSTDQYGDQRVEGAALYWRYGAFDKVDLLSLRRVFRDYTPGAVLSPEGERIPITSLCPDARQFKGHGWTILLAVRNIPSALLNQVAGWKAVAALRRRFRWYGP